MATELQVMKHDISDDTMLKLVTAGDCSGLNSEQKLQYYKARCDAAGLDPRATPFQFIKLQGKDILYATKSCADQLTNNHKLSAKIIEQRTEDGIRVVSVRISNPEGRELDDIGAVNVKGLAGDALCNACMKAVTKAKRRATLSFCGLGMLDETELETIPAQAKEQPKLKSAPKPSAAPPPEAQAPEPPPDEQAPPESNGSPKISDKQRKRMYAIARDRGMNDTQFKDELIRMGYKSSTDVLMSEYEDVCSFFESWSA